MNQAFKKIAILLITVMMATGCANKPQRGNYRVPLLVGKKKIFVEVAKTPEEKRQGLSGREKLKDNQGMLFDFSDTQEARPAFWMKGMKFNLDLIWVKKENFSTNSKYVIIGITPNVPAPVESEGLRIKDNELPLYYSPSEVDWVLEVNGRWSEKNGVKVGDEVRLE